jgi:predicted Zn-dependent protease with MMP-like domain
MTSFEGPLASASTDPFEEAIDAGLAALPDAFRTQLGSVAIVVEEWPTTEQLTSVGARGLFGLYQGVPRTAFGADRAQVASKITIFRGPLERRYRDPGALRRAIVDTLHHELAHHLGISDARLAEIHAEGDRGS